MDTEGETPPPTDAPEPLGCEEGLSLGTAPLRRLTRGEYDNTIRDLLGDDSRPAQAFVADDTSLGFATAGHVSTLVAQQYMDAAETIAARAVSDLDALLPCDPAPDEAACVGSFIAQFAPRAFRRPLEPGEQERLDALFVAARAQLDLPTAVSPCSRPSSSPRTSCIGWSWACPTPPPRAWCRYAPTSSPPG